MGGCWSQVRDHNVTLCPVCLSGPGLASFSYEPQCAALAGDGDTLVGQLSVHSEDFIWEEGCHTSVRDRSATPVSGCLVLVWSSLVFIALAFILCKIPFLHLIATITPSASQNCPLLSCSGLVCNTLHNTCSAQVVLSGIERTYYEPINHKEHAISHP